MLTTLEIVRKLRSQYNYRFVDAWRDAPLVSKFNQLESEQVRINAIPDEVAYIEDFYSDNSTKEEQNRINHRINQEGIWIYQGQILKNGCWETIWDCGGFIGRDFFGSGYDVDCKVECIKALDAFRQEQANELSERATYAGF